MHSLYSQTISQLIGFIAVGLTLALYQFNSRRTMLIIIIVSSALYAVHFLLLGAPTGAIMNSLNIFRSLVFLRYAHKKRPIQIMYLFIVLFLMAGVLTWQGPLSLLPMTGMISGTIAYWQLKTKRIRRLALIASPCWLVYNVISGSYPGMVAELVSITSNIVAMYRFDSKKQLSRKRNLKRSIA